MKTIIVDTLVNGNNIFYKYIIHVHLLTLFKINPTIIDVIIHFTTIVTGIYYIVNILSTLITSLFLINKRDKTYYLLVNYIFELLLI